MYCIENSLKQEHHKPRKSHRNTPSFSSTLLDEIYRSIDGEDVEKPDECDQKQEKPDEKPVTRSGSFRNSNRRRTRLVEKWMEDEKLVVSRRKPHLLQNYSNNGLLLSSTSSSSESSDMETFGPARKYNVSCHDMNKVNYGKKTAEGPDHLVKSKSTTIKIYSNLKKMKQPISPGGRLTSFLSSLFNHATRRKKAKNIDKSKGFRDTKSPEPSPTCSTAPPFSRSYLRSSSPDSGSKIRSEVQRVIRNIDTPSHHHVGHVRQGSRACQQKSFYDQERDKYIGRKPPLPPNALKLKSRRVHEARQSVSKSYQDLSTLRKMYDRDDDDDDHDGDDGISDSSSDLFELDHLGFGNDNRYCDELPVYETTCFDDRNRAIARRLVF